MTVTLNLKPDIEAGLLAQAEAAGMSLDNYIQHLVEKELAMKTPDAAASEGTGMVWENGLFIYRTGRPLPSDVIDDAIRRSREDRSLDVLGELS